MQPPTPLTLAAWWQAARQAIADEPATAERLVFARWRIRRRWRGDSPPARGILAPGARGTE